MPHCMNGFFDCLAVHRSSLHRSRYGLSRHILAPLRYSTVPPLPRLRSLSILSAKQAKKAANKERTVTDTSTPTTTSTAPGILEYVDPNTVQIGTNIRSDAPLTREFIASVRENGVITPVLAYRDTAGAVIIRAGQRRTLAAREAALPTIPVYMITGGEQIVERIVQQLVENEQRENITDTDRTTAYQQLAFEGLTPTAIAKRTGSKPALIKTGLAVAANPVAADAVHTHQLTLDQAAVLIEFDGYPPIVDALIRVATEDPDQFEHAAQRARDDIQLIEQTAAAENALTERGYTILTERPSPGDYTSIHRLTTADGEPVTEEDLEQADGRAAYVRVYYRGEEPTVSYFIADPTAAGFTARPAPSYQPTGGGQQAGPMTEEQKVERRTVIAGNKAWDAAETVRRDWLATFLTRKTLPKDAGHAIARGLTTHRSVVGTAIERGNTVALTLLGLERHGYGSDPLADLLATSPTNAQHVSLAVILGGIEDSTSRNTWRRPSTADADYFGQLAAWGYPLSDIEQQIITPASPAEHTSGDDDDEHENDPDDDPADDDLTADHDDDDDDDDDELTE